MTNPYRVGTKGKNPPIPEKYKCRYRMTKKMRVFPLLEFAKLHRCQCDYRSQLMIVKTHNSLQGGPYRETCQQYYIPKCWLPKDLWVLIFYPIVMIY